MVKTDIEFIEDVFPVWDKLENTHKEKIRNSVRQKTFNKNEHVHKGLDQCSGLYIIKSGQLRAYIISDTGKEITLYRLFERDICLFSASCIMKNINFDIYIQAETETTAILIPTPVYQDLMQKSLPVSDFTNQIMASRFSDVMWILEQVLFTSFDKRLATFLLEQVNINNSDTLQIIHEEIANNLGTAREVVTRMLKYFQSEGMVKLSRGEILITNKDKLRKLI